MRQCLAWAEDMVRSMSARRYKAKYASGKLERRRLDHECAIHVAAMLRAAAKVAENSERMLDAIEQSERITAADLSVTVTRQDQRP